MREIRCRVGRGLHRGLPRACMAPSGPRPLPETGLGRLWRPFDLAERGATLVRGWWLAGTGCGLRVAYRQDQIGTQLTTSVLPRRTYRRPRKRLVADHPSWRVVRSISSSTTFSKVSGVIDHFTSGTAFRMSARAGCGGTVGGARQIAQAHDRTRRWEVSHGVLRKVGPDEHRSESRRVEPAVAPATQRVSSAQMVLPSGSIVVPQASATWAISTRPRPPLSMWPGFRGCG